MRSLTTLFALLLATSLSAANVRFDPPNPTSATPVVAHIYLSSKWCPPTGSDVQRHGRIISVTLETTTCGGATDALYDYPVSLGIVPPGVYDVVVGLPQILLGLAEGNLTVQDANAPFGVYPNVGTAGDLVQLRGAGEVTSVTFGGIPATVTSTSSSGVTVRVPALPAGPVDVVVNNTITAVAAFDVTGSTDDPAFFTPVLIPVFFSGPGAMGSQWRTELSVANENDFGVPGASVTIGQNESEGKLMSIPRQGAENIFFDARVRDTSREAEDLGAELPVVREKNFYSGAFDLLNVPADPRFRVSLRAYRIDDGTTVHVKIRPMLEPNAAPLVDVDIPLHTVGNMRMVSVPNLAGYPQLAGRGPLVITIAGGPAPATWAFVSITNNDTQRVTMIAP